MATIILSAVGFVLAGPPGAAIGAAIGQQVDQRVFAPKARQGPRLNDLKIQTSSYATPIPKLFGTVRTAGTVIWATDLREDRRKVSNGKGAPKSTIFSYSASFAVVLSGRRISRVGRIWADGKLLRGAAGDFKTQTGFRVHLGAENQAVDPLLAAAEGAADTPAYRGIAYTVFEDFQLADYGNRIPSLSFEVIADEGDVPVGAIINQLSGPALLAHCPTPVSGFSAFGNSVAAVCQTLQSVIPFSVSDDGTQLTANEVPASPITLPEQAVGAAANAREAQRLQIEHDSASLVPSRIGLSYADPARDYQTSVQQARRDGGGRREIGAELPATLSATAARRFAENLLARAWVTRKRARIQLPWRFAGIGPGATVIVAGYPDVWQVRSTAFEKMSVVLDLVRHAPTPAALMPATAGRGVVQPDRPHGPTSLVVLDLPPLDDGVQSRPSVAAVAAGTSPGWRGAALLVSTDDGASWQDAGVTAAPGVLGATTSPLPIGSAHLTDTANSVDIQLLNGEMALIASDDDGLLAGRNAAMLGKELIQFGAADALGGGAYRLSRLLRGRRGTQIVAHGTATPFTLIEREWLAPIEAGVGVASVRVIATGVGDTIAGVEALLTRPDQAIKPPPPVHLRVDRQTSGDWVFQWTRQSRDGWRWPDLIDVALAEEQERYRLLISPSAAPERESQALSPAWTYTAAERAADAASGSTSLTVSVAQIGTYAISAAAFLTVPLS